MSSNLLKKIVIIGTTGSGKTTFMKTMDPDFDGSSTEVLRNISKEDKEQINTFTPIGEMFQDSTTTVSMNVKAVLFLTTKTNQFHYYPLDAKDIPFTQDEMDNLFPTLLFDTAGQERFDFMQDIGIQGAHGVIIFADGTNIQSIERISNFYEKVKKEQERLNRHIPIVVFINKKDMEAKGLYIGKGSIARWVPDLELEMYETSNFEPDTFTIPLRNLLGKIEGFPVPADKVTLKNQ